MLLSILIPTMHSRYQFFRKLKIELRRQCKPFNGEVEIIVDTSEKDCVGKKRNNLLTRAIGRMVASVDDDDIISKDYIQKLITAIKENPYVDCIGISGEITTNGKNLKQWHISKEYGSWKEENNIYYRTPNHISPVRRELALQVGFPEISHGEDYDYSMRLLPLLKTEAIVEGNIYLYRFKSKKR